LGSEEQAWERTIAKLLVATISFIFERKHQHKFFVTIPIDGANYKMENFHNKVMVPRLLVIMLVDVRYLQS